MHKFFSHPIIIVIVTILALAAVFSLNKSGKRVHVAKQNVAVLEHEIAQIAKETETAQAAIAETQSDFFKESALRNELLLQKPEEYVLQIPNPEEKLDFLIDVTQNQEKLKVEENTPIEAWLLLLK